MHHINCSICGDPVLCEKYDKYLQIKPYYLQIINKQIEIFTEEDLQKFHEITDHEYYVCETCHLPKILQAKQKLLYNS